MKIEDGLWKQTLNWDGEPVLTVSLQFPRLSEETAGQRRIARYYRQAAEQWKARWTGPLFLRAQAAARLAREQSRPFRPWEAALTYRLTVQSETLLSLYLDAYEFSGGAHGVTVRQGDTWELPRGLPRSLASFFPPRFRWRRAVLEQVRAQIEARLANGEAWFFEDWRQRLPAAFDPEHFYCTQAGPAVFFPLYRIAPYAEGISVFPLSLPEEAACR